MGQRKGKDGPTYKHFAAWCGMRRRKREKVVLMENVPCACFSSMAMAVFRFFFCMGVLVCFGFPPNALCWQKSRYSTHSLGS